MLRPGVIAGLVGGVHDDVFIRADVEGRGPVGRPSQLLRGGRTRRGCAPRRVHSLLLCLHRLQGSRWGEGCGAPCVVLRRQRSGAGCEDRGRRGRCRPDVIEHPASGAGLGRAAARKVRRTEDAVVGERGAGHSARQPACQGTSGSGAAVCIIGLFLLRAAGRTGGHGGHGGHCAGPSAGTAARLVPRCGTAAEGAPGLTGRGEREAGPTLSREPGFAKYDSQSNGRYS